MEGSRAGSVDATEPPVLNRNSVFSALAEALRLLGCRSPSSARRAGQILSPSSTRGIGVRIRRNVIARMMA